jgi:hypothetical protein
MGGYYININVRSEDAQAVRDAVVAAFETNGFPLLGIETAQEAVEDEARLANSDDCYGVLVSGVDHGWVTVYVDDWKDSGVVAGAVTKRLSARAVEMWVANDTHWGYNYWQEGTVRDRFADDPLEVADSPDEEASFAGDPAVLAGVAGSAARIGDVLDDAHEAAGTFAGGPLGALCDAIDLPFERAFTGYEYFFTDDPDDYVDDHPDWPESRHLCFRIPQGRETLAE